jgi:hypothetical protein
MVSAKLSISRAWSETGAFLAKEARLVLPIALLLLAIPAMASELILPEPAATPSAGRALLQLTLLLVNIAAGLVGVVAITNLALRPGTSVGEALRTGLRRFPPLFVASLMIGLGFVLIAFVVILLFAGAAMEGAVPPDPRNLPPSFSVVILLLTVLGLALWIRFMMVTPVATAEPVGPIGALRRSWALTRGHYWRLLGTFLLLLLVATVAVLALSSTLGIVLVLLAGPPEPGNLTWTVSALVSVLFQTLMTVVLGVLAARVYRQLAGEDASTVFA